MNAGPPSPATNPAGSEEAASRVARSSSVTAVIGRSRVAMSPTSVVLPTWRAPATKTMREYSDSLDDQRANAARDELRLRHQVSANGGFELRYRSLEPA